MCHAYSPRSTISVRVNEEHRLFYCLCFFSLDSRVLPIVRRVPEVSNPTTRKIPSAHHGLLINNTANRRKISPQIPYIRRGGIQTQVCYGIGPTGSLRQWTTAIASLTSNKPTRQSLPSHRFRERPNSVESRAESIRFQQSKLLSFPIIRMLDSGSNTFAFGKAKNTTDESASIHEQLVNGSDRSPPSRRASVRASMTSMSSHKPPQGRHNNCSRRPPMTKGSSTSTSSFSSSSRRTTSSVHHDRPVVDHTYVDHYHDPVAAMVVGGTDSPKRSTARGGVTKPFPEKLHAMLSHSSLEDVVGWQPHGRAFLIHDKDVFVDEVMPR